MSTSQSSCKPASHPTSYDESALAALNAAAERIADVYLKQQIQRITQRIQHELLLEKAHYAEENHELARSVSHLESA